MGDNNWYKNEPKSGTVHHIFHVFVVLGSATMMTVDLVAVSTLTKRCKPIDKVFLYKLFRNRLYLGEAVHKGTSYPGEHQAIIDEPLWDQVHAILQESPRQRAANTRTQTTALLKGLIFADRGIALTPTVPKKGSRHYRYYTSMDAIRNRGDEGRDSFVRLHAGVVDGAARPHIRSLLLHPEHRAQAPGARPRKRPAMTENDV